MTKDIEREAFEEFYKTQILTKDYEIEMIDKLTEFHTETGLYEYARMQTAWASWQTAKAHEAKKLEGCVILNGHDIKYIADFMCYSDPENLDHEVTIQDCLTGFDGKGIYAWVTEYPEEGGIKLGDVEAARSGNE